MNKRITSIKEKMKKQNHLRLIFIMLLMIILSISLAGAWNSSMESKHIRNVEKEQSNIKNSFEKGANEENSKTISQDNNNPAIVLINVAEDSKNSIKAKSIKNIILVVFNRSKKTGYINLCALNKEMVVGRKKDGSLQRLIDVFDEKKPDSFYKIIEEVAGFKTGAYIVYNNNSVKKIMDIKCFAMVSVGQDINNGIDDVKRINETVSKYAEQYNLKDKCKIKNPGNQSLKSAQVLAYLNIYNDVDFDNVQGDWRHLLFVRDVLREMKDCNLDELEKYHSILSEFSDGLDGEQSVKYCASVRTYHPYNMCRWPYNIEQISFKGETYLLMNNVVQNVKLLHKVTFKEKKYRISSKTKQFETKINKIRNFILEYVRRVTEEDIPNDVSNKEYYNNNSDGNAVTKKDNNRSNTTKENNKSKQEKTVQPKSEPEPLPDPAVEPDTPSEPVAPVETEDQSKTNSTEPEK